MNTKLRRLTLAFALLILFLSFIRIDTKIAFSELTSRKIDLFTQKAPFDGKGINQSCDAFQPQELVILYALVTYNEAPVANKLVAFQINNPTNAIQNMTIIGVNSTDQDGVATFSFRIPWPSENAEEIIFGEWFAIATVDIAEKVVVDTLTFQVGWMIKITKITTLNAKFEPQAKFLRGDLIVFDLTIENIALTLKSATIMIDAQDADSYPIIHIEMDNLVFQPGENPVRAYSQIPPAAAIGEATVSAAAYTAPPKIGGVLYSPKAISTFEIIKAPVPVEKHDIAVLTVSPSKTLVCIGEVVNIYVIVKNEGTYVESFDVTTFYDSNVVGKLSVSGLEPGREMLLIFYWGTRNVTEGNYTLSAEASVLPSEINIENNKLVNGVVWVKPWTYPIVWIPIWFLALLFLLVLFIGVLLLLVLMFGLLRRRRRKKKDKVISPIPPTITPFRRKKKCKVCGEEFPEVYTFCPYCFTFHGKDYE